MNLLELTVQGGVLIAAVLLLRGLLRYRLPAWTFRILWGVALVRLLVPLSLPAPWSVYTGLDHMLEEYRPDVEIVQSIPEPAVSLSPALPEAAPPQVSSPAISALPAEPGPVQDLPASALEIPWPALLWLAGALVLAALFLRNYRKCLAAFRTALPLTHPAVLEWRNQIPALRGVPIRQCDRIGTPLTYGLFRPVVLLPKGFCCDRRDELGYVLLHEGAHIRHRDAWWKLFLAAALCVHWFNPLVWCMYVCAGRDLERCCDEAVIRRCGLESRSAYALTLLQWEERRSGLLPLCSPFSNKIMKERVISIMKLKKQSAAALVLAAVLVAGTTAAFATTPASEAEQPQTPVSQNVKAPDPQPAVDGTPIPDVPTSPAESGTEPVTQAPAQAEAEAPAPAEEPADQAPASRYPVNQSGQTYGVWTEADGYEDVPDLIYFCWDEATAGYLRRTDLYPYSYPLETQEQQAAYVTWYTEKFGHLQGRTNVGSYGWSTPLLDQEGNDLPNFYQGINVDLDECTLSETELWDRLESGTPPRPYLPFSSIAPETIPAGQRTVGALSPEEAANPPQDVARQLVNGDYPRNSKGETYGCWPWSEYTGYTPDLIAVVATDTGARGYVERIHMNGYYGYPYPVNTWEDSMSYMEWLKTQPAERQVPVYDAEHETVLGYYTQTNTGSYEYVHTPEEIEEEIQMITDMMTKNGYSQQEIDQYIQQLRERYAQ